MARTWLDFSESNPLFFKYRGYFTVDLVTSTYADCLIETASFEASAPSAFFANADGESAMSVS